MPKYLSKDLLRATHNARHPKRRKDAENATKRLKTYGKRLVRELERNLPKELIVSLFVCKSEIFSTNIVIIISLPI